jgi:hypothetical protein
MTGYCTVIADRFRHGVQGGRPRFGIVVTDKPGACAPLPIDSQQEDARGR